MIEFVILAAHFCVVVLYAVLYGFGRGYSVGRDDLLRELQDGKRGRR